MAQESEGARLRRFEDEALPHLDALFHMALRMLRNRSDAEDLVQDTVLKAYRHFDRYRPGTNCKAWMFKILTNTAINEFAKRSRRPRAVDFEDVEPVLAREERPGGDLQTGGDMEALADLLDDEVQGALASVPESFRAVLLLAAVEGFAYKDIAAILDIPIGTVMSRLFRGRKLMQAALRDYARRRGLVED